MKYIDNNFVLGYIVIPKGVNRDRYVKACFTKELFCIQINDGGFISDALCVRACIDDLEFPVDENHLGSQVVVLYIERHDTYIITGIINKMGMTDFKSEGSLSFQKNKFNTLLGLFGNALSGSLKLFIKSIATKASKLYIEVSGNKDSKLTLASSGWILLRTNQGFTVIKGDKSIRINDEGVTIYNSPKQSFRLLDSKLIYSDNSNKFTIDEKGYSFGNINFKDYIQEILDFLNNNIILNTPMGPTSPGCSSTPSVSKLQELKQKLDNINKQ